MDILYIGRYYKDEILTGPEKVAKRIFDCLSKSGKLVFIEYFFDGKEYGIFKKLFGKEIVDNVNGCDIFRLGIVTMFFKLFKSKPKIIHIITFERFAFVSYFCKIFFRTKIIYSPHGLIVYENKNFRHQNWFCNFKDKTAENVFFKYSNIILVLSENFKRLLCKDYKINESKIRYVRNGIDSEYNQVKEKKIFYKDNILKIVFIADINRKEKGFLFLVKSLELTENKIELYVIDKKENIITFKNDLIKVFCFDKMPSYELADFLKDKDVYISTSYYEPFSITSVECMASGVITVLTKETGASELIKDGINGFVYDYGDSNKLINIINTLVDNFELKKNISKEAVKIYEDLNWEKISYEYLNIYKSI
ncbi:MAG: glycosyltransferase family 4 protein [Ignavibacteria bacterium]|jgi:glycosyltransferase involved in cell wall biosynthesis